MISHSTQAPGMPSEKLPVSHGFGKGTTLTRSFSHNTGVAFGYGGERVPANRSKLLMQAHFYKLAPFSHNMASLCAGRDYWDIRLLLRADKSQLHTCCTWCDPGVGAVNYVSLIFHQGLIDYFVEEACISKTSKCKQIVLM